MPVRVSPKSIARVSALLTALAPAAAGAQTLNYIWNFSGPDGTYPVGGVARDKNGNLYATTQSGGAAAYGTVIKLTPPATAGAPYTETTLWSLDGANGFYPQAGVLLGPQGTLFGTARYGGGNPSCVLNGGSLPNGCGSVFELSPPTTPGGAWVEKTIWAFGNNDGFQPIDPVIRDTTGRLYGTTATDYAGNAYNCYCGTVFALTPPTGTATAWRETVLHVFSGAADGQNPNGGVAFDAHGNLYGITNSGGANPACPVSYGCGTVFKLTRPTTPKASWAFQTIWSFSGAPDGSNPVGDVTVDKNGNVYGTTQYGGNQGCLLSRGCGVAFKLAPPAAGGTAWAESILYTFQGAPDFDAPLAAMIFDKAGNLWGTASDGGTNPEPRGGVFKLAPPSSGTGPWTETIANDFLNYTQAPLTPDPAGDLFTTQPDGGYGNLGAVVEVLGTGFVP